ncbi:hypothetical protein EYF80_004547 [Liparis tanakae]|uniref:Uncharacterized protein n=1 Tax=Liparis tanakae TaxID=230148 RepID=A0A4Z2J5A3_9TELE|nr:hypothetical protein EYF80_004547 [Liparis tanakae]
MNWGPQPCWEGMGLGVPTSLFLAILVLALANSSRRDRATQSWNKRGRTLLMKGRELSRIALAQCARSFCQSRLQRYNKHEGRLRSKTAAATFHKPAECFAAGVPVQFPGNASAEYSRVWSPRAKTSHPIKATSAASPMGSMHL